MLLSNSVSSFFILLLTFQFKLTALLYHKSVSINRQNLFTDFFFNSVSVIMREYAGLAKDAVHIGGSVYDKNGAEISGVFLSHLRFRYQNINICTAKPPATA
ncbi:hypothetical protein DW797_07125 [Ruminococcus sp. AM31-32]|nr:hypothetical protein DW797_07125 [Ruminococcus sp. AM31-32]